MQVISPSGYSLIQITEKVVKRAAWILRQQEYFRRLEVETPVKRYLSGETHYYLGRQYRLKIKQSLEKSVKLKSGFIEIQTLDCSETRQIQKQLTEWYRKKAQEKFTILLEACVRRLSAFPFQKEQINFRLQQMAKRWGSCTTSGHILLHPDLIKTPKACIEYIILHELAHLVIPHHNQAFYDLQSRWMPDWQKWKDRLERFEGL